MEAVRGFQLRGDKHTIDPVLPDEWPGFELTYRYRSTVYEISVARREGTPPPASPIQLMDDGGKHNYDTLLWGERQIRSVANMTRQDARDFLKIAHELSISPRVSTFSLDDANQAMMAVKAETSDGSAVIVP